MTKWYFSGYKIDLLDDESHKETEQLGSQIMAGEWVSRDSYKFFWCIKRRDSKVPHEWPSLNSQQPDLDSASELPSTFQPHILLAWGEWPTVWVKSFSQWPAKTKKKKKNGKRKPACVRKHKRRSGCRTRLFCSTEHARSVATCAAWMLPSDKPAGGVLYRLRCLH